MANMAAQRGFIGPANPHPCHLGDLAACLDQTFGFAARTGAGVRMPRIGCGLGGATWDEVGPLVEAAAERYGVAVTVCELPKRQR